MLTITEHNSSQRGHFVRFVTNWFVALSKDQADGDWMYSANESISSGRSRQAYHSRKQLVLGRSLREVPLLEMWRQHPYGSHGVMKWLDRRISASYITQRVSILHGSLWYRYTVKHMETRLMVKKIGKLIVSLVSQIAQVRIEKMTWGNNEGLINSQSRMGSPSAIPMPTM